MVLALASGTILNNQDSNDNLIVNINKRPEIFTSGLLQLCKRRFYSLTLFSALSTDSNRGLTESSSPTASFIHFWGMIRPLL